jgi:SAM-dependent methyltransferase
MAMTNSRLRVLGLALLEDDLRAVRAIVRGQLDPAARTLDVACGPGLLSDLFAEGDYVGLDADPAVVDLARRTRPGSFLCEDPRRSELPDQRFDQALAFDLCRRFPEARVRAVLAEVRRLLVSGGRLLLIERQAAGPRLKHLAAECGRIEKRIEFRSGFRHRLAVLLRT